MGSRGGTGGTAGRWLRVNPVTISQFARSAATEAPHQARLTIAYLGYTTLNALQASLDKGRSLRVTASKLASNSRFSHGGPGVFIRRTLERALEMSALGSSFDPTALGLPSTFRLTNFSKLKG